MQRKILVIDDLPPIVTLLKDALTQEGYEVDGTVSTKEALQMVKGKRYDLVMIDIRMPEMDGRELYRKIVAMHPDLTGKIVITSADQGDAATNAFIKNIGCPFLFKPFTLKELNDVVTTHLNGIT